MPPEIEYVAWREFSTLYIAIDLAWFAVYLAILLWFRKFIPVTVGLFAGVIYFLVDYGIFYHLTGSRTVEGADPLWFLFWMSMTVGFTNFAWMWILLDRDRYAFEWSLLTIMGFFGVAIISQAFGGEFPTIKAWRTTSSYHGYMMLILMAGYTMLIVRNVSGRYEHVNLLWLLAIGVGIQLSWEVILFITKVRPVELNSIAVRSLLETNLGMPYAWLIHRAIQSRWSPDSTANAAADAKYS